MTIAVMKTKINVTQLNMDEAERQRLWEETRRHPLYYFRNRFQWFNYPKWRYVAPFPLHVDFEASSNCNLTCPMCFRRHMENTNNFTDMNFDLYKKGIDECAENELYSIRLSWRGESTLHPQLIEMIAYARKSGIKEISFLTNGSGLNEEFSMRLIKAGLDYITISVDGLRENYNKLRAPLDFDETVANIKSLYGLREGNGYTFSRIKVQGIFEYFKGKEAEYYETFRPITDNISFNVKHDYQLRNQKQEENLFCPYLWQRLTITASGLIPLCISDWDTEIEVGNLAGTTIKEVWLGEKMEEMRRIQLENRRLELRPCQKCIRTKDADVTAFVKS